MTLTYSLTTYIGKVRLKINDKDLLNAQFTDEEIQVFLDDNSNSILLASAQALETWAAAYAANASQETIGDYSFSQKVLDNMLKLAETYRAQYEATPSSDWAEFDMTDDSVEGVEGEL